MKDKPKKEKVAKKVHISPEKYEGVSTDILDINEIELHKAVESGDKSKIKKILDTFFKKKPSDIDRGRSLVETLHDHIGVSNKINKKYLDHLKEVSKIIKTINTTERDNEKDIKIIQTKKRIVSIIEEDDLDTA
jgi:hypothetical protein